MNEVDLISAGGVVYRIRESRTEVLICRTSNTLRWVIPKGLVDPGETVEQAALREVREEVGVVGRIIEPLYPPENYVYMQDGVRIYKTVHYFLMEYVSGKLADHDHEMDIVLWASLDEAIATVSYDSARSVLQRAKAKLQPNA